MIISNQEQDAFFKNIFFCDQINTMGKPIQRRKYLSSNYKQK